MRYLVYLLVILLLVGCHKWGSKDIDIVAGSLAIGKHNSKWRVMFPDGEHTVKKVRKFKLRKYSPIGSVDKFETEDTWDHVSKGKRVVTGVLWLPIAAVIDLCGGVWTLCFVVPQGVYYFGDSVLVETNITREIKGKSVTFYFENYEETIEIDNNGYFSPSLEMLGSFIHNPEFAFAILPDNTLYQGKVSKNVTENLELAIEAKKQKREEQQQIYLDYVTRDTLDGYREFLEKYPQSPYIRKIKDKIVILVKMQDEKVYLTYLSRDTIEGYEEFIREYPDNIYVDKAQERLRELLGNSQ